MDQVRATNNDETADQICYTNKIKKRKVYKKEHMTTRRRNKEFRNEKSRALQAKRLENMQKTSQSQRQAFINAKNRVLILLGKLLSRYLLKVNRITLRMYQKWKKCTEEKEILDCLRSTQVTMSCFSHLLKDQVVQQIMKYMN